MRVTKNISYNFESSFQRIDEILDSSEIFEEVDEIPDSEKLTYKNGYYINCYSIFIDIRDSSKLPEKYQSRILAKIYRAYISEVTAIFQSFQNCKEINIVGDSVWAVFNSKTREDVKEIFAAAYKSNSLIASLNYKLCKKGIDPIRIGIGISKGRALMVQAGFNGSGINDVIWMGHVVNQASKMCSKANKEVTKSLVISKKVYEDLEGYQNRNNNLYQSFFESHNNDYYFAEIIDMDLNEWLNIQKLASPCTR
jgi:class 3 adenylate cyclase